MKVAAVFVFAFFMFSCKKSPFMCYHCTTTERFDTIGAGTYWPPSSYSQSDWIKCNITKEEMEQYRAEHTHSDTSNGVAHGFNTLCTRE